MSQVLTREDIERASRREGVSHPVVSVLEYNEPRIAEIHAEYSGIVDGSDRHKYLARNFGFLGDALEEAGDFSLDPLDLVAIWSKAMEIWPRHAYPRYRLACLLSASYGIQDRPNLKGLSRYHLETSRLPIELVRDKTELLHIRDRVQEIGKSLGDLDIYVSGGVSLQRASELAMKRRDGDEEAGRQLDQLIAHQKEHQIPLLSELHENFGNGMAGFMIDIHKAIKHGQ